MKNIDQSIAVWLFIRLFFVAIFAIAPFGSLYAQFCPPPDEIYVSAQSPNNVLVFWTLVMPPPETYIIDVSVNGIPTAQAFSPNPPQSVFINPPLQDGDTLVVCVGAVCSNETDVAARVAQGSTLNGCATYIYRTAEATVEIVYSIPLLPEPDCGSTATCQYVKDATVFTPPMTEDVYAKGDFCTCLATAGTFIAFRACLALQPKYLLANDTTCNTCNNGTADLGETAIDCGGTCDPCTAVAASVILSGAYGGGSLMLNTLQDSGLLPTNQPYYTAPWHYNGSESLNVFPPNTVDWVLIEIHAVADTALLSRRVALLKTDGTICDIDGNNYIAMPHISIGSYFMVLRHRNHLAVQSAVPIWLPNDNAAYSFVSNLNQAAGTEQLKNLAPNVFGLWAGDVQTDGIGNHADYNQFISLFGTNDVYATADINLDGNVNIVDFEVLRPFMSCVGIPLLRY